MPWDARQQLSSYLLLRRTFGLVEGLGRSLFAQATDFVTTVKEAVQYEVQELRATHQEQQAIKQAQKLALVAGQAQQFNYLDTQIASMQRDSGTYCDEPEDAADFEAWLGGFDLEGAKAEVEKITRLAFPFFSFPCRFPPGWVCVSGTWSPVVSQPPLRPGGGTAHGCSRPLSRAVKTPSWPSCSRGSFR